MLLSQYLIIEPKLNIINKKMNEKITYLKKVSIMDRSLKLIEIKAKQKAYHEIQEKQIIQAKLAIINKKMNEKSIYLNKYCIMNRSIKCKVKWMEMKALHNIAIKLGE